jgi:hypothetical protein
MAACACSYPTSALIIAASGSHSLQQLVCIQQQIGANAQMNAWALQRGISNGESSLCEKWRYKNGMGRK